MYELFPMLAGVFLGLAFATWLRLCSFWVKSILVFTVGFSFTMLTGEYAGSWGFVLIDIGQVALAASVTAYLRAKFTARFAQRLS